MQRFLNHPPGHRLPLPLEWLLRTQAVHAWIIILLCADVAVLGDLATGSDLWFGPLYLVVICLAAWSVGWFGAHLTGFGCMAAGLAINGANLYPYGGTDIGWNAAARVLAVSLIITVITGSRRAYIREWWLARLDPLTGVLNRKAFFEFSEDLADRSSWRLLIYSDLDGLKQINDQYGHDAGDSTLRQYALATKRAIRRDDLFARVGGDEFLIFMSVKDADAGRSVAARVHKLMNDVSGVAGIVSRCCQWACNSPQKWALKIP